MVSVTGSSSSQASTSFPGVKKRDYGAMEGEVAPAEVSGRAPFRAASVLPGARGRGGAFWRWHWNGTSILQSGFLLGFRSVPRERESAVNKRRAALSQPGRGEAVR